MFENPLRAKAAAKSAQSMSSESVDNDVPTIVPTFPASKFVVEEETSHNYMEEGGHSLTQSLTHALTHSLTHLKVLITILMQKVLKQLIE